MKVNRIPITFSLKKSNWIILTLALAILTGCTSQESGSSTGEPEPKNSYTMGFSQIGAESGWRTANTQSIKTEAEKRGVDLKFSDAQQKQENQIKAIRGFIAQGVDIIAFAPVVKDGWGPVLQEAKRAGIPVFVSDRKPDVPDELYVTFIGSDFVAEGKTAAEWLIKKTGGTANIVELKGTAGSDPAIDRSKGFAEGIASSPGMKIVADQVADFTRTKGKEAMEAILKSNVGKTVNAVYAHNDDMALGAIQAIEEAGLKPGEDIVVISIDGVKDAFESMVDGQLNCTVECNPLLGPTIFDTAEKILAGEEVPRWIRTKIRVFDQSTAAEELPNRQY